MNIQLDSKTRLLADSNNYIIETKTKSKKGKDVWSVFGYFSCFKSAISCFLDKEIRLSSAKTIDEIKEVLDKVEALLKKINKM